MSSGKIHGMWIEFRLPQVLMDGIHNIQKKHFSDYEDPNKPFDKEYLHTTLIYTSENNYYTKEEIEEMLNAVTYLPTAEFKFIRRGDYGPVYFLTMSEKTSSLDKVFSDVYALATKNHKGIDMTHPGNGTYPRPLHVTLFFSKEQVDDDVMLAANKDLDALLDKQEIRIFTFDGVRAVGRDENNNKVFIEKRN